MPKHSKIRVLIPSNFPSIRLLQKIIEEQIADLTIDELIDYYIKYSSDPLSNIEFSKLHVQNGGKLKTSEMKNQLKPILSKVIKEQLTSLRAVNEELNQSKMKIKTIYRKYAILNKKTFSFTPKINYTFILLLIFSIASLFILSNWVKFDEAQVTVVYNVGEIIGGVLIGTGIATAGVAYANKSKNQEL